MEASKRTVSLGLDRFGLYDLYPMQAMLHLISMETFTEYMRGFEQVYAGRRS